MHEFGHGLDYNNNLSKGDKELQKIIKDELREYRKVSTSEEEYAMEYLIDPYSNDGKGTEQGAITEIIADAIGLISAPSTEQNKEINQRSILLQKHFPRTIAYMMNRVID